MDYDTVRLDDENNAVVIIDQTKLPGKIEIISLHTAQEIWNAIYLLQVRGAPAIGVAAAYGIYVLAKRMDTEDYDTFYREFVRQKEYLDSSRPPPALFFALLGHPSQLSFEQLDAPLQLLFSGIFFPP